MAIGNEFLTSNLNIAYPFQENAEALARIDPAVHGAAATIPSDFFVDAHFSVGSTVGGLYLTIIRDLGSSAYEFVFENIVGIIQATVTVDISTWITSDIYSCIDIYDYTRRTYGKIVLYKASALAYLSGTTLDLFQFRLPIESTVAVTRNLSVETFKLYTALPVIPEPTAPGPISGNVLLQSGYNVVTEPTVIADEDRTVIAMSAAPRNQAPCSHGDSTYVKGLMQLLPDENGNIQITGGPDGCYAISPLATSGTFQINGSCTACCSCDDYKNVATAIQKLLLQSKTVLTTLTDAHNNYYTPGVEAFNSVIAPRYTSTILLATGHAGAAWVKDPDVRSGALHLATLSIIVRNNTEYKYLIVPNYVFTTTGMTTVVSLREWQAVQYDMGKTPYRDSLTPLSTFDYSAIPDIKKFTSIPRGQELRHRLLIQVPYYDATPIDWEIQISAPAWGSIDGIAPGPVIIPTPYVSVTFT